MKRIRDIAVGTLVILLIGLVTTLQAQAPYRLSHEQMKSLLERIEKETDRFRDSLDNGLDKSHLDDSKAEDNINQFVKDFEAATDRLKDRFSKNDSAVSHVEEVLRRAESIDSFMQRHSLKPRAQNDWTSLRRNLDDLGRAYDVSWNRTGLTSRPDRLSHEQLKSLLERLEKTTNRFRDSLDNALDKSRLDDTKAEDNINQFVKDFEAATHRLKDRFDENQSAVADVEEVLKRAASIESFLRRSDLKPRARNDWTSLRSNLDELARAYGVSWNW